MCRVGAPSAPTGQARVAGIDADRFAVLRADVDPASFNRGLRAERSADLPSGLDLALLGLHLDYIAFESGKKNRTARRGWWRREVTADLFQIAFEFHAPARPAILGVGAADLVAHAIEIGIGEMQEAGTLECLHGGNVPLPDLR